jgi:hypothetical protein
MLFRWKIFVLALCLRMFIAGSAVVHCAADSLPANTNGPTKVEIRPSDDGFQLYVGGQPFFIKGAGLEQGSIEKIAAHGGNSFRTWTTRAGRQGGQQILDAASKNGLYVTMGLDVGRERQGFDYDDPQAVARQLEDIKRQVLKYKDHPALIIWAIGNELNLNAENPKVWDAVNDISKMIHQVDPNHLTTTPIAGFNKKLVATIKARAPDLDLLAFQMYGDIVNLPRYLKEVHWTGPYIITEWGATGHWEVPKTDWGAPLENNSTVKAGLYQTRYETAIAADPKHCLGSYVFLWGQKQERTPTWYGLFLKSGEDTATVDTLNYLWEGRWPQERCPQLEDTWLDGKQARENIHLNPGQTYSARVVAESKSSRPLAYSWQIMQESGETTVGGDRESIPTVLPDLIADSTKSEIELHAPSKPGAYRLFVYALDGHGHAAHANIPFYVNQ